MIIYYDFLINYFFIPTENLSLWIDQLLMNIRIRRYTFHFKS